jgi:hypothetical protein
MGPAVLKMTLVAAVLLMAACSDTGTSPRVSAETSVAALPAADISGTVYEGDILTGAGQLRHVVVHLKFADGSMTGYAPSITDGPDVTHGVGSGHWESVNDVGDMAGTFSIQSDTTSENLEFVFTGNASGISGTIPATNGSFSLTATGALMN